MASTKLSIILFMFLIVIVDISALQEGQENLDIKDQSEAKTIPMTSAKIYIRPCLKRSCMSGPTIVDCWYCQLNNKYYIAKPVCEYACHG
ncbi:hypothetical protein AQUCO_01000161v1 [Aquilegia coerulea]|uniref:Embryo surrounding factor 1 brassicaceae domain-containing protein n=1 Tax=Aquilegia coerulea TaxID=218851 RepID=A0A2G5E8J5_AQUCA|nr:hypothetical protein AQUCO_01000161v1 [Aquilegia coerulea]